MASQDTSVIERAHDLTRGEVAERLVVERLRAVLPPDVALLHHVRWLLRDRGHVREGEADIVIGDRDRGILVVEVKSGEVGRKVAVIGSPAVLEASR